MIKPATDPYAHGIQATVGDVRVLTAWFPWKCLELATSCYQIAVTVWRSGFDLRQDILQTTGTVGSLCYFSTQYILHLAKSNGDGVAILGWLETTRHPSRPRPRWLEMSTTTWKTTWNSLEPISICDTNVFEASILLLSWNTTCFLSALFRSTGMRTSQLQIDYI